LYSGRFVFVKETTKKENSLASNEKKNKQKHTVGTVPKYN